MGKTILVAVLVASCVEGTVKVGRSDQPLASTATVDCNAAIACKGDRSIHSGAELLLLKTCSTIEGNLVIHNIDGTTLEGLECLSAVQGDLKITDNTSLANLRPLGNLTSVGGSINIVRNASLANLTGFENLTALGTGLIIRDNAALTTLTGLENLRVVPGLLWIRNARLTSLAGLENLTIVGGMTISGNHTLTSLHGFEQLTSLRRLDIVDNKGLTSLHGFEQFTSLGSLDIADQEGLISLAGLENLTSVEQLSISRNDGLTSLRGLENLASVESLTIRDNDGLTSLRGLENLTNIDERLTIDSNHALTSLGGLEGLLSMDGGMQVSNNTALANLLGLNITSLGSLSISGNDDLSSLQGLPNFTSLRVLNIFANKGLTSLNGFPSLTTLGTLSIRANPNLTNLRGLGSLTSIENHLSILANDALTNLLGLENIASVGGNLAINTNARLPPCQAQGVADRVKKSCFCSGNNGSGTCNFCTSSTCNKHGTCEDSAGAPVCTCDPGWNPKDNCFSCAEGFHGPNCKPNATCTLDSCSGHGSCDDSAKEPICSCDKGYVGAMCEKVLDCTGATPCSGNRTARNPTDLRSLRNCSSLTGSLRIRGNDIFRLEGTECLTSVGNLQIDGNAGLIALSGIHSLETIRGTLTIADNTNLSSLTGLDNLSSVERITISNNAALPACEAQRFALRLQTPCTCSKNDEAAMCNTCTRNTCAGRGSCENIAGEAVCTCETGWSSQDNCISCAEGFRGPSCSEKTCTSNSCSRRGICRIATGEPVCSCNPGFFGPKCAEDCSGAAACLGDRTATSAEALLSLRSCSSVSGSLRIESTNASTLEGLECLTSIGEDLLIHRNPTLASLHGLENLHTIAGTLSITDNPELPACEIDQFSERIATDCNCRGNQGCTGQVLADFHMCANADLQSTLAIACAARRRAVPIQASTFGDAGPPQIEVGRTYGVRLKDLGDFNAGTIAFTAPSTDDYVMYLGTPNVPVQSDEMTPTCSRYLSAASVAKMVEKPCDAFRGAYLLPQTDAGTNVRIRLGPISPQRWVRLLVLPKNPATHWAQSGRSPRKTAYNPHESFLTADTVQELQILWSAKTRDVSRGKQTLIQHGDRVFVNAWDMLALDRHTGVQLWKGKLPGVFGTPAYANHNVYSRGENALEGMAAATGRETFRGSTPQMDFFVSDPTTASISEGTAVYWVAIRFAPIRPTFLYKADASSGTMLYSVVLPFSCDDPSCNLNHPAVANGNLFVSGGGLVVALNAETGVEQWRSPVSTSHFGPAVLGGRVFVPHNQGVSALAEDTGQMLWTQTVSGQLAGKIAVTFHYVYLVTNASTGGVILEALDVTNGRKIFATNIGDGGLSGDLSIAADVVYMGQDNGHLYAIHTLTGTIIRSIDLGDTHVSAPAISMGQLFVAGDTNVYALGLP